MQCVYSISSAYDFKQLCKRSEATLQELYNKECFETSFHQIPNEPEQNTIQNNIENESVLIDIMDMLDTKDETESSDDPLESKL